MKIISTSKHRQKGFTLVELAIVLVVIGLLIGGVLVGQSLIESAKTQKLIREVDQYTIQIRLFKEKFRYLPGDFPNFVKFFGNTCNKLGGNTFCDGNGDGKILNIANGQPMEELRVFEHMYRTGIVKDLYLGEEWWATKKSNPISSISSAKTTLEADIWALSYFATYPSGGVYSGLPNVNNPGNWFFLRPSDYNVYNTTTRGVISPTLTMALDGKLDDGMPRTGDVRANNPNINNGVLITCIKNGNPATYYTSYTDRGCNMYIKMSEF